MATIVPASAHNAQALPEGFIWQNRHSVGDEMFAEGYRAYVPQDSDGYTVVVRKPDGTKYRVNPYIHTCTCMARQFRGACKHEHYLCEVVDLSAQLLEHCGKYEESKRLYEFWGDFVLWVRGGRN